MTGVAGMRSIIESKRFERERGKIAPDMQRWDDVMRGVTWALSMKPESAGQSTDVVGIYGLPTDDWPGVPQLVIYFRFDAGIVELLSVRAADPAVVTE